MLSCTVWGGHAGTCGHLHCSLYSFKSNNSKTEVLGALSTSQALSRHAGPVVALWDSTEENIYPHSHRKFYQPGWPRIALSAWRAGAQETSLPALERPARGAQHTGCTRAFAPAPMQSSLPCSITAKGLPRTSLHTC